MAPDNNWRCITDAVQMTMSRMCVSCVCCETECVSSLIQSLVECVCVWGRGGGMLPVALLVGVEGVSWNTRNHTTTHSTKHWFRVKLMKCNKAVWQQKPTCLIHQLHTLKKSHTSLTNAHYRQHCGLCPATTLRAFFEARQSGLSLYC